jgi:3-isopropylmalate dehydrogenase
MAGVKKLLVLPGDGIGPEVMREVKRVVDWLDRRRGIRFEIEEDLVGGASIDARGTPLADSTVDLARAADPASPPRALLRA